MVFSISALLLCAVSFPVRAAVFYPETYMLANGMQVVIVPYRLSEAVAHVLWYKAGAIDDPIGKSGVAHYLEHMMFKKTKALGTGEYSSLIASKGGADNAFTTYDTTAYHVQISKEHLPFIMQMEAERMQHLQVDQDEAKTEKEVILREREQRTENQPIGQFYEKLNHLFWGDHRYGRPVIGWRSEIEQLRAEDIHAFYKNHYAPQKAILIISGDVRTQDVLRYAAGTFGRIPRHIQETASFRLDPPCRLPIDKTLIMHDARVKQPLWIHNILAPHYAAKARQSLALSVLAETLAGGEVGLLYRHFVVDQKQAAFIDASYDSMSRGSASFSFIATPSVSVGMDELDKNMKRYLLTLAKKGVTAKDVDAAKQRLLDGAVFARDSLMASAQTLGNALAIGLPIEAIEKWPDHIKEVTTADVNAALRALVAEPHFVTGQLLPEGKER